MRGLSMIRALVIDHSGTPTLPRWIEAAGDIIASLLPESV